jgi:hypothetical protein
MAARNPGLRVVFTCAMHGVIPSESIKFHLLAIFRHRFQVMKSFNPIFISRFAGQQTEISFSAFTLWYAIKPEPTGSQFRREGHSV